MKRLTIFILGCVFMMFPLQVKATNIEPIPGVPVSVLETIATAQDKKDETSDLYILAHVISGEAGSDYLSDTVRYYVGSVVLNRVANEKYPDTIKEVVYQRGQYACLWDGNYDKPVSDDCWRIAEELLKDGSKLPSEVIYQAQFSQGSGVYYEEHGEKFCYE